MIALAVVAVILVGSSLVFVVMHPIRAVYGVVLFAANVIRFVAGAAVVALLAARFFTEADVPWMFVVIAAVVAISWALIQGRLIEPWLRPRFEGFAVQRF